MKQGYVYILTNSKKTVLYIGVTSNLRRRIFEHKNRRGGRFTKKYGLTQVVYYEHFSIITEAIYWEKILKGWGRRKKTLLISEGNPDWIDLDT